MSGAGGLILLAAAHETGLITTLQATFTPLLPAQWSTRLWHADRLGYLLPFPVYLDGHKKPVFSDVLVPRGRIGRTGKILGCRTLTVLHDPAGHPLIATTARGDAHLTATVPALLDQSPRGYPHGHRLIRPDHHH